VKARAESLGGRVEIHSKRGVGTRFTITLPFTLTKSASWCSNSLGALWLPTQSIRTILGWRELPDATEASERVARVGCPVPLRSLAELLGREPEPCSAALVVAIQEQLYGFSSRIS
jgi:chemotaxis protein histidine kinase CheA